MSNATNIPGSPLTLEGLQREIVDLRNRIEDLEDLRDLEEAISDNAGKPLIPWDEAKNEILS